MHCTLNRTTAAKNFYVQCNRLLPQGTAFFLFLNDKNDDRMRKAR